MHICDTRDLRSDYHTLGFNQQKSKLSSVETQNSYVRWHLQQHFTVMTENGAFTLRSDIHTPTAPSCRGSNQRLTIEKSREATTHKSPQYYVNKLRQNVGLETWIWRHIVTSQTAHTKYKWPPYATEWNPPMKIFFVRQCSLVLASVVQGDADICNSGQQAPIPAPRTA